MEKREGDAKLMIKDAIAIFTNLAFVVIIRTHFAMVQRAILYILVIPSHR